MRNEDKWTSYVWKCVCCERDCEVETQTLKRGGAFVANDDNAALRCGTKETDSRRIDETALQKRGKRFETLYLQPHLYTISLV